MDRFIQWSVCCGKMELCMAYCTNPFVYLFIIYNILLLQRCIDRDDPLSTDHILKQVSEYKQHVTSTYLHS